MAISRYDQRINLEEAEANAIGTEYLRADLLPADDASRLRELLRKYTDHRISFYLGSEERRAGQRDTNSENFRQKFGPQLAHPGTAQPTTMTLLVVWGMNDVLNSQGYTQAAW